MKSTVSATLLFAAVATAQLGSLPACAQNGFSTPPAGCSLTNIACICSAKEFINNISCYIADHCNKADQDATIAFAQQFCGANGVTVPSVLTCDRGTSAAAPAPASTAPAPAPAPASAPAPAPAPSTTAAPAPAPAPASSSAAAAPAPVSSASSSVAAAISSASAAVSSAVASVSAAASSKASSASAAASPTSSIVSAGAAQGFVANGVSAAGMALAVFAMI